MSRAPAGLTRSRPRGWPAARDVAMQQKLHAWELQHLREVTAEQHQLLEAAAADREDALRRLSWAEDAADRWRDDALAAINRDGCAPGLTMDGQLVAVKLEEPGRAAYDGKHDTARSRFYTPATEVRQVPGVKVWQDIDGECTRYEGPAAAIIATGIICAAMLPGAPGMPSQCCTFVPLGSRDTYTHKTPGYLQVKLRPGGQVFVQCRNGTAPARAAGLAAAAIARARGLDAGAGQDATTVTLTLTLTPTIVRQFKAWGVHEDVLRLQAEDGAATVDRARAEALLADVERQRLRRDVPFGVPKALTALAVQIRARLTDAQRESSAATLTAAAIARWAGGRTAARPPAA